MDNIIEYKFYYPERKELSNFIDKTLKEYAAKYENSPWYIELKDNTQFFDKIENKKKPIDETQSA